VEKEMEHKGKLGVTMMQALEQLQLAKKHVSEQINIEQ